MSNLSIFCLFGHFKPWMLKSILKCDSFLRFIFKKFINKIFGLRRDFFKKLLRILIIRVKSFVENLCKSETVERKTS